MTGPCNKRRFVQLDPNWLGGEEEENIREGSRLILLASIRNSTFILIAMEAIGGF